MIKFKHNKKKNSAFLYEVLVLELTRSVLRKDESRRREITSLIKKTFRFGTEMHKELRLYHSLMNTTNTHPRTAERVLSEVIKSRESINKKKLLAEQDQAIRHIKNNLPEDTLSNFVPNYKSLATIYQIFNQSPRLPIESRVLLENQIIKNMITPLVESEKKQMLPIDNLVYKTFTKNFNSQYSSDLLQEQKDLLSKFISSFMDNGLGLKLYLNEEIGRLKKNLKGSLSTEDIANDLEMVSKVNRIIETLEGYKQQEPQKTMIQKVIKIQSLVNEMK